MTPFTKYTRLGHSWSGFPRIDLGTHCRTVPRTGASTSWSSRTTKAGKWLLGSVLVYELGHMVVEPCLTFRSEGRYALVGIDKITNSLNSLINWFQKNQINDEGDMLREACGQEINDEGEEECNYGELIDDDDSSGPTSYGHDAPPPVSRGAKPGSVSGGSKIAGRARKSSQGASGGPPPISRGNKPPSVSRSNKPR